MAGREHVKWVHPLFVASVLAVLPATGTPRAQSVESPDLKVGPTSAPDTPATIEAVIDVTRTGDPINPLMWGHFIENLRNWFERGMWAEMIGDRKFFYPVNNDSEQTPPNRRSRLYSRWSPIGPEDRVVMDRTRAYSGAHAPRILVDGSTPHGIRQPGLGLRSSLGYAGRIVLAGDPSARVEVSLVWGPSVQDRETVTISSLSPEYETHPLTFKPGGDTRDGRLEITGTGSGSFLIGAVSLMRDDNIEGWNPEMLAVIGEMNPTMLRWGGNFSANYEWRDGIGDPDRRPTRYDHAWNAIEPNDVGTLEILALNRLLESEPNIGVNAGLGDAHSAAQWVEYVNSSGDTPMGQLRAEHGHPEPFNVKWWGIGNEMYGEWQIGHMYVGHYVIKHNKFAEAMRAVDPSIVLVATGASRYQMSSDSRNRWRTPLTVKPPFAFDSPQDWSGWLLRHSYEHMDYLSEHIYGPTTPVAFDQAEQRWVPNEDVPLQDRLRRVPNRVRGVVEEWEEYQRRMPWLKDTDIRIVLDEWHAGGPDLFNGLWTALTLNELFRYTDLFVMSAYTCAPCALDYNHVDPPVMRSPALVFKLLTNHLGTIPVLGIEGNSRQPELAGTVGVDKPQVSSGSPTYPLDVMATLSEDRKRLTVSVVNPSETSQQLALKVEGAALSNNGRKWTITGPSMDARNVAGEEPTIALVESSVSDATRSLDVPPISISLYEWQLGPKASSSPANARE